MVANFTAHPLFEFLQNYYSFLNSWQEERRKMNQEFAIRVHSELSEADVVLGTLVACSDESMEVVKKYFLNSLKV